MIVLKFGGTSVMNAERMNQALNIAKKQLDKAPVMVSSAMAKVTDTLIEISDNAKKGNKEEALKLVEKLKDRHISVANDFLTGNNLKECIEKIQDFCKELHSITKGCSLLKECPTQSYDTIQSFGELLSTTLLYYRAKELGINAEWIDSRKILKTDSTFGAANPDFEKTDQEIKKAIFPEKNRLYIAQGFIASDSDNITTTLGRGGSDFTAAIFGASLDAKEIQIWTDVNGIMTTDPRIVAEATTVKEMSYEEAAELAFFGAKVVHPATIQPAIKKNIPVTVMNTNDPDGAFTKISNNNLEQGLKAISGKKNITVININSSRMINASGFLSKIFYIFEKYETSVDLISTSEVSVSVTIDDTTNLNNIVRELEKIATVTVAKNKAIICFVGKNLWHSTKTITKVFSALEGTKIRMISLGSSDTNLSAVLPMEMLDTAIKNSHKAFF